VLEVKLLVKGLKCLRDEVILKALDPHHEVLLELILALHEGFLSSIHALNNIYLFRHSLLQLLHALGVDGVPILQILGCPQMDL
jgi:hypothetical protein